MKRTWLLFTMALGVLALALVACGGEENTAPDEVNLEEETEIVAVDGGGSYTAVTVEGVAMMLEEKDFPFINVHIPYEGEIEGTDAFIPFDEIAQHLDELPADKDARIVLYCRSGNMSAQAANELAQLGYTDVWDVEGGMVDWERSGRPLLNR